MLTGKSGTFALAGSGFTLTVGWSETYSIETNESVVSIDYLRLRSSNWFGFVYYIDGKIRVNGVDVIMMDSGQGTHNVYIERQNTDYDIHPSGGMSTTGSTTVAHNTDGTKSISIEVIGNRSGRLYGYTIDGKGGSGWSVLGSQTISLTTIPRATTPTLSAATADMGSTVTADLSSRASASFTHTIEIRPDTSNVWTVVATRTAATSVNFSIPDFAASIPNATNAALHIRCTTYSGDMNVGEKLLSITAVVPSTAAYFPTASIAVTEAALSGYSGFIQGHSRLSVTITASGAAGSTVSSISSTFDGGTYTGASWRSAAIAGAGTLPIRTTVTDSRGRSTTVVHNVSVQAYAKPTISLFTAERCTEHQEPDNEGNYAHIRYGYFISCAEYGVTAAMTISYKLRSASSYINLLSGTATSETGREYYPTVEISSNYTYDLRIVVRDSLGETTEKLIALQSAQVVFDVLASGLGFAFGKTAEQCNVLEVAWQLLMTGNRKYAHGTYIVRENIAERADLNDYVEVGFYRCQLSQTAAGLQNSPTQIAFVMDVYSSTGGEYSGAPTSPEYRYYLQEITTLDCHRYLRSVIYNGSTSPTFGGWITAF